MNLTRLLESIQAQPLAVHRCAGRVTGWHVPLPEWLGVHQALREQGARLSALWAEETGTADYVHTLLWYDSQYWLLSTTPQQGALPSVARIWPNADRPERHTRDMLGIDFTDAPDNRRWTRHQAWGRSDYPLRRDFPLSGRGQQDATTQPDAPYGYHKVQGVQVYEIPVGPVHAGIIEPGHFRFNAAGERVLSLEERLGYVHKGLEKSAMDQTVEAVSRLACRVSGDSAVAHALAFAQAVEAAWGMDEEAISEPARVLRAIYLERERVVNHLGDIGAICNDVGFAFMQMQFSRLREIWTRDNQKLSGHRLMMDTICPGGVRQWADREAVCAQREAIYALREELKALRDILEDYPSLEDRLMGTGVLRPETARVLGCVGYVGKASGQRFDVRVNAPTRPWSELDIQPVVHHAGDVMVRVLVRLEETEQALSILYRLIDRYQPEGQPCLATGQASDKLGLACVEGWRGETVHVVRLQPDGRVARWFPRDPSWLNWPALEQLIEGNIVPDFPVCNKSVNGSYSGHDL